MGTTNDVTTRSPSIVIIEGREYALYQGFLQRTRLVDVKLLWLDTARNLAMLLYGVLMVVYFSRLDSSVWFLVGALAVGLASSVVSSFMRSHSVAVVLVSVVEKERQGLTSTLFIFTRPQPSFSTDRGARLTATVHTDMADFLVGAVGPGRARGFKSRPRVPAELSYPNVRPYVWFSYAYAFAALGLLVAVVVVLVRR
jgi:hypothetical protein